MFAGYAVFDGFCSVSPLIMFFFGCCNPSCWFCCYCKLGCFCWFCCSVAGFAGYALFVYFAGVPVLLFLAGYAFLMVFAQCRL